MQLVFVPRVLPVKEIFIHPGPFVAACAPSFTAIRCFASSGSDSHRDIIIESRALFYYGERFTCMHCFSLSPVHEEIVIVN